MEQSLRLNLELLQLKQDNSYINDLKTHFVKESTRWDFKTKRQIEDEFKPMTDIFHKIREELNDIHYAHHNQIMKAINENQTTLKPPECPICLETMGPPTKIYQCSNGHLVCGNCKPSLVTCSFCRKGFMGRATGMEQYLRSFA